MRSKRGFTATELLIVITLMASIPTGVYRGVKNRAYEQVCRNNLYQINLFLQMYVMDHGAFPRAAFYPQDPNRDKNSLKVILREYGAPDSLFICPTAPEILKKKGLTYVWNDACSGKSPFQIPNAQKTWLLMDMNAVMFGGKKVIKNAVAPHRGGILILYVDGHIAWTNKFPRLRPANGEVQLPLSLPGGKAR